MLICIYGRARWSDIRYIDHVEIDCKKNGSLVLYTSEHKTSLVGERRQQFLPLIIPWHGVVRDDWMNTFLELYGQCGLDINKVPLYRSFASCTKTWRILCKTVEHFRGFSLAEVVAAWNCQFGNLPISLIEMHNAILVRTEWTGQEMPCGPCPPLLCLDRVRGGVLQTATSASYQEIANVVAPCEGWLGS